MANPRPLTPADIATMTRMLKEGLGIEATSRAVSRAPETVSRWAHDNGLHKKASAPARWADELLPTFRKLFDDGLSFSLIAKQLGGGLSRSACIAKASRLGWRRVLPTAPQRVLEAKATRNRTPKANGQRKQRQHNNLAGFNRDRKAASPKLAVPRFVPVVDVTNAKIWTERAFGECAYPIAGEGADTLSCCAKTAGKTYCAAHRAVMFVPPKPKDAPTRSFRPGFSRGRVAA